MNMTCKKYAFLALALVILLVAGFLEYGFLKKHPEQWLLHKFQNELYEKEKDLDRYLEEITKIVTDANFQGDYLEELSDYNHLIDSEGFGFLVFENNELMYWSDRITSFHTLDPWENDTEKLVHLPNGFYLRNQITRNDTCMIGLLLIKNAYPHENEYLKNTFFSDFNLPGGYILSEDRIPNSYPVYSVSGSYLFSVKPGGTVLCTEIQLYIPVALYLIALVFILLFVRCEFQMSKRQVSFRLFILAAGMFVCYWFHILFQFPEVFYIIGFFSPEHFGFSVWLPSLGDYFLTALFFFFLAVNFSYDADIRKLIKTSPLPAKFLTGLIFLSLGGLYLLINFYCKLLIENSSFSFALNHIVELSAQSVIAYLSMALLLFGLALVTLKIIREVKEELSVKTTLLIVSGITLLLVFLQEISVGSVSVPVLVLFFVYNGVLLIFSKDYLRRFTLSSFIVLVSLFSVYSLFIVYSTVSKKERGFQRTYAFNLVTEHDPAAELILTNIQERINVDSVIPTLLIPEFNELHVLEDYLMNHYFNGYLGEEYDIQIIPCTGVTSLNIQPDNIDVPCFPFFEEKIEIEGLPVEGTRFYFMDNMNGRITYFGELHYPLTYDSLGVSVFIELNSKVISEGLGYPELLIERSMEKPINYQRFDYAKYNGGLLVDQYGDFSYNKYIEQHDVPEEEFIYEEWGGHEHIIYRTRGENYVVVSRETYGFIAYLISFPYLFVFYFVVTFLFLLIGSQSIRRKSITFDLKFKIQAAIIEIVLFSLLIIAVGTILYDIDTYRTKHRDDLNEKMKSIAVEFEMRKERIENLNDENLAWLDDELAKLSNVFRTDVNFYGINGELISSSRPEVYEKGLITTKMNPEAYYHLFHEFNPSYIHPEKIGSLSYLSAYRAIFDDVGDYLGFINLPYFTRQDKYRQEITTFIVAFINLYVIFFLASIIVAVFISNQITKPLTLIRENLRKIELGKRSEPIDYLRDDEIGSLVKEYNKKVDKLAVSVELLARSERESAWREMARQIAHEIKNPLTPMKLNIQYLQRLQGNSEELEAGIDRVSKLLIEQIDTLSAIATEFSNFAKMPAARNQVFNLSTQLKKVIDLFEIHDKAIIRLKDEITENIYVKADREQFSRAIINLIKNAIQAIPPDQEGRIDISLSRNRHNALIKVTDNGAGIAEELQDKLFSPSFTTKTSGMGLGLAIVKSIVENFKGRIWFKTKQGMGTTFFVEIPVYEGNGEPEILPAENGSE